MNHIGHTDKIMRDRDVRDAVKRKVLADHLHNPEVLVVDELGLDHGSCRVDIAVVNGKLHGYELKSESDTLVRLPNQVLAYSKVLDHATLVVAENHLVAATKMIPAWWGVKVASKGQRVAIKIETVRPAAKNPSPSPFHIAQLLWRTEALCLLEEVGIEKKALRTNRAGLYKLLAEFIPLNELRRLVRQQLKGRESWRCPPPSV